MLRGDRDGDAEGGDVNCVYDDISRRLLSFQMYGSLSA